VIDDYAAPARPNSLRYSSEYFFTAPEILQDCYPAVHRQLALFLRLGLLNGSGRGTDPFSVVIRFSVIVPGPMIGKSSRRRPRCSSTFSAAIGIVGRVEHLLRREPGLRPVGGRDAPRLAKPLPEDDRHRRPRAHVLVVAGHAEHHIEIHGPRPEYSPVFAWICLHQTSGQNPP